MHVELLVKLLGEMRPPLDNAQYAEGVDTNQQLSAKTLHGVQIIVVRIQHCYNLLMPRKKSNPRRAVVWRVRVLMAERNVRSVSELVRRMEDIGVSISIAARSATSGKNGDYGRTLMQDYSVEQRLRMRFQPLRAATASPRMSRYSSPSTRSSPGNGFSANSANSFCRCF
jgi:hypothetical protein